MDIAPLTTFVNTINRPQRPNAVQPVVRDQAVGDRPRQPPSEQQARHGTKAGNPWHAAVYQPPAGAEPQPLGYTRNGDVVLSNPAPKVDFRI